jgi:hypothetical protein
VTGLWTNDRDTLDKGVAAWLAWGGHQAAGDFLLNEGVVRVLDPNDTELVERLRSVITSNDLDTESRIRAVIETLRQP